MFLLTAGHCYKKEGEKTEIPQKILSVYPKEIKGGGKEIGESVTFIWNNKYDISEVKIENSEWLLEEGSALPVLVEWATIPKAPFVIGKVPLNVEGEETCHTGATTRLQCGEVLQIGVTKGKTEHLIETSVKMEGGDSGAPQFARSKGGVLIQGVAVTGGGGFSFPRKGTLTKGKPEITEVPEGKPACKAITEMKADWKVTRVPVVGKGIPVKTTVKNCEERGANATIEMSAAATESGRVEITIGHPVTSSYEPMSEIETVPQFKGQKLLVR